MVVIQCKGGSAREPTDEDRRRLREIRKHYDARAAVLFRLRKGKSAQFSTLNHELEWEPTSLAKVFGDRPRRHGCG